MALTDHIPKGEALRFLVAGGGNTLFGLVDTFAMTFVCVHLNPSHAALMTSVATLLSTVINTLPEYLRSFVVYGPSLLISVFAAGPMAAGLAHWMPQPRFAPYVAQAIIVAVAIVPQFLGHKKFTFKKQLSQVEVSASTEQSL